MTKGTACVHVRGRLEHDKLDQCRGPHLLARSLSVCSNHDLRYIMCLSALPVLGMLCRWCILYLQDIINAACIHPCHRACTYLTDDPGTHSIEPARQCTCVKSADPALYVPSLGTLSLLKASGVDRTLALNVLRFKNQVPDKAIRQFHQ